MKKELEKFISDIYFLLKKEITANVLVIIATLLLSAIVFVFCIKTCPILILFMFLCSFWTEFVLVL